MVPCDRILKTAREKQVDFVGLSGLITPSLDEMVHVAREMEREGFTIPLLIGGATTSRAHTAIKIAPAYRSPVVHVLDASRAVGVVGSLINPEARPALLERNLREQEALREQHRSRRSERCCSRSASCSRRFRSSSAGRASGLIRLPTTPTAREASSTWTTGLR